MIKNKQDVKPKPIVCPLCGASPNHEELFNRFGTNKRGDITGNLTEAFKTKDDSFNTKDHPFYLENGILNIFKRAITEGVKGSVFEVIIPDAIEGHHLITCESVNDDDWKDIFEAFGYDINDAQNGCFFPRDIFVACHLRVPLHQGNHNATFGMLDPEDKLAIFTYVESVRNKISNIKDTALEGSLCEELDKDSIKNFHQAMMTKSEEIFVHLKKFEWTLTADGFDYKDKEVGCYDRYRTVRKKRNAMMKDKTISILSNASTRDKSKALGENLKGKEKCKRDHKTDGCKGKYPFSDADWYLKCRYNDLDDERFN